MSPDRTIGQAGNPQEPPERRARRRQRAEVPEYTVVRRLHEDIEIDTRGHVHVFWGSGDERIHSGGPTGFNNFETAINQHQEVINRYQGYPSKLTQKDVEELNLPDSEINLKGYVRRLREAVIAVPGERTELMDMARNLETRIDQYQHLQTNAERKMYSERMLELSKRFGRVQNEYKKRASQNLQIAGTSEDPSKVYDASTKALLDILQRISQITTIVGATQNRLNLLYEARDHYEETISRVSISIDEYRRILTRDAPNVKSSTIGRLSQYLNPEYSLSLPAYLKQVDGQPYKGRVESREVRTLTNIPEHLQNGNYQTAIRILQRAYEKLWRIEQERQDRQKELYRSKSAESGSRSSVQNPR